MMLARILGVLLLAGMLVLGGDFLMQRWPENSLVQLLRAKTMSVRLDWMKSIQQEITKNNDHFENKEGSK